MNYKCDIIDDGWMMWQIASDFLPHTRRTTRHRGDDGERWNVCILVCVTVCETVSIGAYILIGLFDSLVIVTVLLQQV